MKNMKIAINHYGRFELPRLELVLAKLDSFIVTPEIEKSRQFITGVERGKFEVIEVTDLVDVERAVNVTDDIIEECREQLTAEPEPEEPTPPAEPEAPSEVPEDEAPAEDADEGAEEQLPAEEGGESEESPEQDDESEEEEKVLSFTELAGNVDSALKAIAKETDIEKLNKALELDERVTVRKAINARLVELKE
jgi:hypothetical protein